MFGIGDIVRVVVAVGTGGQSEIIKREVEVAGETVKVVIDLNNRVVTLGKKVFRAIPGEVFMPGIGPLADLLKNEVEDEFLLLTPIGLIPSVAFYTDQIVAVASLLHIFKNRTLRNDEADIARFVFGDSFAAVEDVTLTNISGLSGRAFTIPSTSGGVIINLGSHYRHDATVDIPLLMHELTHGWQIRRARFPEIFYCEAIPVQVKNSSSNQYTFTAGQQWRSYNLEQQASIVQSWVQGDGTDAYSLGSSLFPYINGNVRTADNDADVTFVKSIRQYFAQSRRPARLRSLALGRPSRS